MHTPSVSVLVPSYNSRGTIRPCLESLLSQDAGLDYEIIVVDSSRDDTAEVIRRDYPRLTLVHTEDRLSPGAARNRAAAEARGEVLAFIDSDCVADASWLRSIVRSVRDGYRIAGGAVANLNPESAISKADYLLTFNEFAPGMPCREVGYLPSANLACTRELFAELGGFPADLRTGEDMVFTSSASRKTRMLFEPRALVYHRNRTTLWAFVRHHFAFGSGAAAIRRARSFRGSLLARVPFLAPAAPAVRAARVAARILRHNRSLLPWLVLAGPWVLLGLVCWGVGFVLSSFRRRVP
jgi:glycosyltransferase involved in cell wall biosynthesis